MEVGSGISRSHSIAHGKFSIAPGRSAHKRVIINVGGVRYETFKSTLKSIPDTRLSWLAEAQGHNPDYDPTTGEYFFDRHPAVFNMILNYYRTGKLHAPTDVCGPLFEEELAFWGIDEKQIEPCCWAAYRAHRDAQETLAEFDSDHSDDSDDDDDEEDEDIARRFGIVELQGAREEKQGFARWQPRVWHLLEDPNSSPAAKVVATLSVIFILLYIAIFVAESHVVFRDVRTDVNVTWSAAMTVREVQKATRPKLWLSALEYTCVIYFTLELILRTVFCPDRRAHCRHFLTWVDILSLLPFYIHELVVLADASLEDSAGLYILKSVRVIRILRILRLTRYFSGLKILGHTLKASARELLLMILVLGIGVLVFACFIYYVEQVEEGERNDFKNIPIGFWWAVVTMTTLGYGDMYPRTALGYIVGAICALCGLLMLALPVPVIVNNFTLYYSHAQAKMKLPQKKKNMLVGAADALKNSTAGSTVDMQGEVLAQQQQQQQQQQHVQHQVLQHVQHQMLHHVLYQVPQHLHPHVSQQVHVPQQVSEQVPQVPGQEQQGSDSSMDSSAGTGSLEVGEGKGKDGVCRKTSDDSVHDSVDSGFKTGSASTAGGGDTIGISVIFTDELATSPNTSPILPPHSQRSPSHLSPSVPTPSSDSTPEAGTPPEEGGWGAARRLTDKRNSIHVGVTSAFASRKGNAGSFRRRSLRPTASLQVDIVDVEV